MFYKLMSGDIISLDNSTDEFSIEQLESILNVPRFRIHVEQMDDSNCIVFVNDHPHKLQKYYGGIVEGLVDSKYGEYEMLVLRVYRRNDDVHSEVEWLEHTISYYFEPTQNIFLAEKDVTFDSRDGDIFITASKLYRTLFEAISASIEDRDMKPDTVSYVLDEISKLSHSIIPEMVN